MGDRSLGAVEARSKPRTIAWVLYGTLLLLLLSMPEEVAGRLDDLPDWTVVRAARSAVGGVVVVSNALGIAPVYRAARDRFLDLTGLGGP